MNRLALAVLILAATTLSGCGSGDEPEEKPPTPAAGGTSAPSLIPAGTEAAQGSWALAADQTAAADRAGLPMFANEVTTVHYHAHLDLLIRGEPVLVPAFVGIDRRTTTISPLHTHDTTGTVHIESPQDVGYTLGQFFTEWGQRLSDEQIGPVSLADGEQLRVYRNGKLVTGDPAAIVFVAHAEYFIWVGPAGSPPSKPPATYRFPKGL